MAKSLVLSVSVGTGCYRHIQISENRTLESLSSAILSAFDFMDDHLHSFFMSNIAWDEDSEYPCYYNEMDDERAELFGESGFTNEVTLREFDMTKGDRFLYIFDYGDEWRFWVKVLRVIDEDTKVPVILKSKGEVVQYPYDDEEEDWDDDEE